MAFSLDSQMIEQKTSYSVVNLGLDANLGLRFILKDAKRFMKKDDIIIISPEYDHFGIASLDGDGLTLVRLIAVDPRALGSLTSFHQIKNIFSNLLSIINIEFESVIADGQCLDAVYCRRSFNKYGDVTAHLTMPSNPVVKGLFFPTQPNAESMALIKNFSEFADKQSVKVFYSFPPLAKASFDQNGEFIMTIFNALQKIPNLIILGAPEVYIYNDDLFFDTMYHLNAEGRNKRTSTLIQSFLR